MATFYDPVEATPAPAATATATPAATTAATGPADDIKTTKSAPEWKCSSCSQRNWGSRLSCRGCSSIKPGAERYAKPGDWECPDCSAHCYAKRDLCIKCRKPRPFASFRPGSRKPSSWECTACGVSNYGTRFQCRSCSAPRPKSPEGSYGSRGGYGSGYRRRQPSYPRSRPGDWLCVACAAHNFASREVCRSCSAPKPAGITTPTTTSGSAAPSSGSSPAGSSGSRGYSRGYSRRPRFTARGKPGDWNCLCGFLNFSRREECHQCEKPKSSGSLIPPAEGDWNCGKCDFNNFAFREECYTCHAARGDDKTSAAADASSAAAVPVAASDSSDATPAAAGADPLDSIRVSDPIA